MIGVKMKASTKTVVRCTWASNELSILYHDREWGMPQHDDRVLFEFLILEGAQAGLSWDTILRKRENYRARSVRSLHLAVCRWETASERLAAGERNSGADFGIGRDEQGSEETRLQLRRLDHLLRVHAGYWVGQRPRGRVFPLSHVRDAAELRLGGTAEGRRPYVSNACGLCNSCLKPVRFYAVARRYRAILKPTNHCLPSTYIKAPSPAATGTQAAS